MKCGVFWRILYSNYYYSFQNWEMLILSKLQWDVCGITGFDFVDHILERCSWGNDTPLIRRHAHTLVSICYTGKSFIIPNLLEFPSSI